MAVAVVAAGWLGAGAEAFQSDYSVISMPGDFDDGPQWDTGTHKLALVSDYVWQGGINVIKSGQFVFAANESWAIYWGGWGGEVSAVPTVEAGPLVRGGWNCEGHEISISLPAAKYRFVFFEDTETFSVLPAENKPNYSTVKLEGDFTGTGEESSVEMAAQGNSIWNASAKLSSGATFRVVADGTAFGAHSAAGAKVSASPATLALYGATDALLATAGGTFELTMDFRSNQLHVVRTATEDGVPEGAATYVDPTDGGKVKWCATYEWAAGTTAWEDGKWYLATGEAEVEERIKVSGSANLILADGAKLAAKQGIRVGKGASLTIWGQLEGSGRLEATGPNDFAGIGGEWYKGGDRAESCHCGVVTINGGVVVARGGKFGAGIGGSDTGDGGVVTVNGGEVMATGAEGSAGIGGGDYGNGGEFILTGGKVTATGSTRHKGERESGQASAGIGAGRPRLEDDGSVSDANHLKSGKVSIRGGEVAAFAGEPDPARLHPDPAQAMGVNVKDADHNEAHNPGWLELKEVAVYTSEEAAEPVLAGEREEACRGTNVWVRTCTHRWQGLTCVWCGTELPLPGQGTEEEPYLIGDYARLVKFAKVVNGGKDTAWARLTNDIVATGTDWVPIGNDIFRYYHGTFDGDGHTIRGLSNEGVAETPQYAGLFGTVADDAAVRDVRLEGVSIKGTEVGGIVGLNHGTVSNCCVIGSVSGEPAGGVVGNNYGTVANCWASGRVSGNGFAGGIAGSNAGVVTNCYGICEVPEFGSRGGVVGYNGSTVANSYCLAGAEVVGYNHVLGTVSECGALSAEEFRDVGNFEGWDFENVWWMGPERPLLRVFGVQYPLWVGGVQVTSKNATDILGDGTARFEGDATGGTLALENASITSWHAWRDEGGKTIRSAICSGDGFNLAITVAGTNRVALSRLLASSHYGIAARGPLAISGEGVLSLGMDGTGETDSGLPVLVVDGNSYPVVVGPEYTFTSYLDCSKTSEDGRIMSYQGKIRFDRGMVEPETIDGDNPGNYMPNAEGAWIRQEGDVIYFGASDSQKMDFSLEKEAVTVKFTVLKEGTSEISGILTDGYVEGGDPFVEKSAAKKEFGFRSDLAGEFATAEDEYALYCGISCVSNAEIRSATVLVGDCQNGALIEGGLAVEDGVFGVSAVEYGLSAGGLLSISNATVSATSQTAAAISSGGVLSIAGPSVVTAETASGAAVHFGEGIAFGLDLGIQVPEGGGVGEHEIVDADGQAAGRVVIRMLPQSETVGETTWYYLTYADGGTNATVVGAWPAVGDLTMPGTLGGLPVVGIGAGAFEGCGGLTGLRISDGVGSVGAGAFDGCTNLATVWVPVEQAGTGLLDAAGLPEGCEIRYYGTQGVTFAAGAGTCPTATNAYAVGEPYGWLPVAEWDSLHEFEGWRAANGGVVTTNSIVTGEARRMLVARWRTMRGLFITEQPEGRTVQSGESVTFSVGVRNHAGVSIPLNSSTSVELVFCPAGTFEMGSPDDELGRWDNETRHTVTLTHDFWLGKYELRQKEYAAVMGENPAAHSGDDNLPVERVDHRWAQEYCDRLTAHERSGGRLPEGYLYALPTEAEWEYACRAGTTKALNSGKDLSSPAECAEMDEVGWYKANRGDGSTHLPGLKSPNAWGLYDMHGNVEEWCWDWYQDNYPAGAATNPTGPSWANGDKNCVRRGGSWKQDASVCRSAARRYDQNVHSDNQCGFRLALVKNRNVTVPLTTNVSMEMTWVDAGTFRMGSPTGELGRKDDETQHDVTLTEAFWLGKYEVTQKQWDEVMGDKPEAFEGSKHDTGNDLPIYYVSRDEALAFCAELTARERAAGRLAAGWKFSLPTEAQWEYACRAGTTKALNSEHDLTSTTECSWLDQVAWYKYNSGDKVHFVEGKNPNNVHDGASHLANFSHFDMHGNVREWVLDRYGAYPTGSVTDPTGPEAGSVYILRGGGCTDEAEDCRSAARLQSDGSAGDTTGFRVAIVRDRAVANAAPEPYVVKEPWCLTGGVAYQWYRDGEAIEGATGASLSIDSAALSDAGRYTVTVTAAGESATSAEAVLAVAESETVDGVEWWYVGNGEGATVVGAVPAEGDLTIPATLGGATVTAVGAGAFKVCTNLTGLWIPDGVGSVGAGAFEGSGLVALSVPGAWRNSGVLEGAGVPEGCQVTYRGGKLRIMAIGVGSNAVSLQFNQDASTVFGTDDLKGEWKAIPRADLTLEGTNATIPLEKAYRFLRAE